MIIWVPTLLELEPTYGKEPALALEVVVEREAEEAGDQEQHGERAVLHQLQALDECRLLGLGRDLGAGTAGGVCGRAKQ